MQHNTTFSFPRLAAVAGASAFCLVAATSCGGGGEIKEKLKQYEDITFKELLKRMLRQALIDRKKVVLPVVSDKIGVDGKNKIEFISIDLSQQLYNDLLLSIDNGYNTEADFNDKTLAEILSRNIVVKKNGDGGFTLTESSKFESKNF